MGACSLLAVNMVSTAAGRNLSVGLDGVSNSVSGTALSSNPTMTLQDGSTLVCQFTATSLLADNSIVRWGVFPGTSVGVHLHIDGQRYELIFSNGAIDALDWSSFKGGVYYRSISFGPNAIVGSGLHYFPPRAQFTRRFGPAVLPKKSILPYGPTRVAFLGAPVARTVNTGEYYSAPMGPFYPCMLNASDEPGGSRIEFTPGWDQDLPYHIYSADRIAERMPIAAFDKKTGRSLTCVDFGRKPFEYRLTRGYNGIVQYPHFDFAKKFNTGTCEYEQKLLSYLPFDDAHLIRGIADDIAVAYLSNDWVARFRIGMVAADVTVSWSLFPSGPLAPAYPGQWIPFSLPEQLYHYTKYPHTGGFYGRAVGWDLYCVAASYDLGNEKRLNKRWLETMYSLADKVALPTGITYSMLGDDIPYSNYGMPRTEPATPYFQVPIFNNGLFALHSVLNNDPTIAKRLICGSANAIRNLPKVTSAYGPPAVGPGWYLNSTATSAYGPSHWMHCFIHLAQAYRLSNDTQYLADMQFVGVPADKATLLSRMQADSDRNFWTEAISVLWKK